MHDTRTGGTASDHGAAPDHGATPDREARFEGLLGRWWADERPAWTDPSWWAAPLREDVRALLWLPAGPQLATALAGLPRGPVCPLPHHDDRTAANLPTPGHAPGWPCACQVVTAAAWEATAGWVAAGAATALVDAASPHPVDLDVPGTPHQLHDPARDELATALRWTTTAAGTRISTARTITAHPRLLHLVGTAAISAWAARLVTDHLTDLTPDQATRLVDDVADKVHTRLASGRRAYNSADINRLARAARLRLCPLTAQEARIRSWAARRVTIQHRGDGNATLIADLADTDAHRIHRRLTAIATGLQADARAAGHPDDRTRDQIRADILTDLLLDTHPTPTPGTSTSTTGTSTPTSPAGPVAPGPVEVQVVVSLDTLLGLADTPAEVPGLGPVPADVARALAADAPWRAWITNTAGTVTATSSTCYTPSPALARLVRAREPRCRFPGCRQPAPRCDLDHTTPWPTGPTTAANLGPMCRHHHQLKTHAGWTLTPLDDPTTATPPSWRWTTPTGLTITDHPEPPLP